MKAKRVLVDTDVFSDIDFIVTRNVKDYSKSSLEVLHPHDFVNIHLCP